MVSAKILKTQDFESILICSDGAWTQMFEKGKLKPEVMEFLGNSQFDAVKEFLNSQNCFDDYSFIALDLQKRSMRKTA